MALQELLNSFFDLVKATLPLFGVIIGGLITYRTQTKLQVRNEVKKERAEKLKAYNEILRLEANTPLVHPLHHDLEKDLEWKIYKNNARNVLYENLNLFDEKIIENVFEIDGIAEKIEVAGADFGDKQLLYDKYSEIIKFIYADYKKIIKEK
ncbi:hypothetical protein ACW0KB_11940 [Virgibacillus salarius]